ncbi:MAG: PQQ-binding-like beta-propeller repeat protein [Anaerolineae bacterium]|nr:PQQ-binding-like beta-propeller repeat protein [Anaerolineae bacterium]
MKTKRIIPYSLFLTTIFLILGLSIIENTKAETPHTTPLENLVMENSLLSIGGNPDIYLPLINKAPEVEWAMVGANIERTSWTPTEVRGKLNVAWYKPFDSYILPRTQIIAANGMLYISTANGLYALNAVSGAQVWVYPTEMPLGHSPTIYKGVAYVGGFDRKIHAINAQTGSALWTFEAEAGFDTNPLIVNDLLYAGNRDGNMYAIHVSGANSGQLAWKYSTGGPIHYSAAYKDGTIYLHPTQVAFMH